MAAAEHSQEQRFDAAARQRPWIAIKASGWNAALFVNNVTDEIYASGMIPQLQTPGFSAANYAPPRMAGLQVWKKF